MDNNGAVKVAQHRRIGALVLNKTQATLVLGCVVVGIIASFGVGCIVGMWYQANEHITPYETRPALATEEQTEGGGMTFYSTLTTPDASATAMTDASATKPASKAPDAASQPPTRPATPAPAVKTGEQMATPGASAVTKRDTSPQPSVVASLQVVKPAPGTPEATSRPPGRTVAPAPPATGERPPALGGEALPAEKAQPAGVPSPSRSSGAGYSVQVGSFRTPEQAEQLRNRLAQKGYPARVQASVLPGKGIWYRVRVGRFPERLAANQTAQRLTTQERLAAIVAAEDGK